MPVSPTDTRKKFGGDANAGVAHRHFNVGIDARETDLYLAPSVCELHRVGQQIPEHLLQALRVTGNRTGLRIDHGLDAHALGFGRRRDHVNGIPDNLWEVHRLDVEPDLSRDDP